MASTWKIVRVFISSTFRDMQAERDHLVRFVFPRLREELLSRRIHLVDVDLRWGVTSNQDALDVCREVIDECRPYFIGLLGGRYGWVPPGCDQSITADEIRHGVFERPEEYGNAFFYLRASGVTAAMVEETPGEFREIPGSDSEQKLATLKQTIGQAGLRVSIYEAQWDATQRRLVGLETFGQRIFDDLLQKVRHDPALAERFSDAGPAVQDEFAEDRAATAAFIEERVERYIVGSRQQVLDALLAFAAGGGMPNIFVLTGEAGSGKSALLARFHESLVSASNTLVLPHFAGASADSTDLRRTLCRLCASLVPGEPLPGDMMELTELFRRLLETSERRVVLIFDALNEIDMGGVGHSLYWLPATLPPDVRIIISTLKHPVLETLRQRGAQVQEEKLAPLEKEDAVSIVAGFLRRYAKRLTPEQIGALLDKSDAHLPLYILTALEELRTLGAYEAITARIAELPGDTRTLFRWILRERLARDPGFRDHTGQEVGNVLVEKFAACLGASRHGLSPTELTALLDPGDPLGNVAALLRLLRPYLMRRGELVDFFHSQFRAAAEAGWLDTPGRRFATERTLADYFLRVTDPAGDGSYTGSSAHALSELPYHQTQAQAWPELVATLQALFFLEGKIIHGMAFDLPRDFADAMQSLPADEPERETLRLLEQSLRRDLRFIAKYGTRAYPPALFQSMWNLCWWFNRPPAPAYYLSPRLPFRVRVGRWIDRHFALNPPVVEKPPPSPRAPADRCLSALMERWRAARQQRHPGFAWVRSLSPPVLPLGSAQLAVFRTPWIVQSVAFSPDGRRVAAAVLDRKVRIWEVETGRELAVFDFQGWKVYRVAYSPDGTRLVVGGEDGKLLVLNAETGQEIAKLSEAAKYGNVVSVQYSPDGRRILSGCEATVRLWDAETGRLLAEANLDRIKSDWTVKTVYSSDGRWIAISRGKTVRWWDAELTGEQTVFEGPRQTLTCVACLSDPPRVISGCTDGAVWVWDTENPRLLGVMYGHAGAVRSVACSPDGRRAVTGGDIGDRTVRVWDLKTLRESAILGTHDREVYSVMYSPDGRRIVSGSEDHTVAVWDAESRGGEGAVGGHQDRVNCVVYSPDGQRVASAARDKTVRVWEAETGRELQVFRGHKHEVNSVAFSPDGRWLVSGGQDKTVRMWDTLVRRWPRALRKHACWVEGVAFSPDGEHVAASLSDGNVCVMAAKNGKILVTFFVERDPSFNRTSLLYSSDGTHLFIQTLRGLRVWDVKRSVLLESELNSFQEAVADSYHLPLYILTVDHQDTICFSMRGKAMTTLIPGTFRSSAISPSKTSLAGAQLHRVQLFTYEIEPGVSRDSVDLDPVFAAGYELT